MPFSAALVSSQIQSFRHSWVYQKTVASNFAQAKYAPMKEHEDVLVFSAGKPRYYPIKEERKGGGASRVKYGFSPANRTPGDLVQEGSFSGTTKHIEGDELRFPRSVRVFNNKAKGSQGIHPTQKPVALFEYLIKTYTRPGELVLDNTAGSGTTAVAAENLGRRWLCMERDENYYWLAVARLLGNKL